MKIRPKQYPWGAVGLADPSDFWFRLLNFTAHFKNGPLKFKFKLSMVIHKLLLSVS